MRVNVDGQPFSDSVWSRLSSWKMLANRLDLVRAYLSPSRNFRFSMLEMLKGVLKPPCTLLGPRFLESTSEVDNYLMVKIRSVPIPLYWPQTLPLFELYKVVTECFYESDWHFYEVPETRVSPGDVVLDCGAAEGVFSLRVLERARQIVAFEPFPLFVRSLRQTFANRSEVTVVSNALGSTEGDAFLDGGSLYGHVTENGQGTPIQVTTIDKWVEHAGSRVDFIKGDLESFELKILQGAEDTIKRYKPKIALTVYHPGNNWRQILSFLRDLIPEYAYRIKGLSYNDRKTRPVMIHVWPE